MHGHGHGFDERSVFEAERVRQAVKNALRHRDKFRERAVPAIFRARNAEHAALFAEIDLAALTEPAFAAIDRRVERHAIADVPFGNAVAEPGDFSRGFVSHDDRRNAPAGAAVHAVNVAPANPAGPHAHEDFVGLQVGHGKVLEREAAIFFEDERFHGRRVPVGSASSNVAGEGSS